jgi:hypothetical protein
MVSPGEKEEKRRDDNGAVWERPALRRLVASEAEGSPRPGGDEKHGSGGSS